MQARRENPKLSSDDNFLHTLACLYAASGRVREARDTVRAAAEARGRSEAHDEVVTGRIAAAAGLTAEARDAYRRVIEAAGERPAPDSTAELARRWMAELRP